MKTFNKARTKEEYIKNKLWRNMQLTFGTVADSFGTKVGAGLKWTFIDNSDPLDDMRLSEAYNSLNDDSWISNGHKKQKFDQDVKRVLVDIKQRRNLPDTIRLYQKIKEIAFNINDSINVARSSTANYSIAIDSIDFLLNSYFKSDSLLLDENERLKILSLCIDFKNIIETNSQYANDLIIEIKKIKEKWLKDHWNATVVAFGAGWVGLSPDNKWNTLNTQQLKSYINGKFKTGKNSQIILLGTICLPLNSTVSDSSIVTQYSIGTRYLLGNEYRRFSFDLGYYLDVAKKNPYSSQNLIFSLGYEYKVSDGIFFEVVTGYKGELSGLKNSNILALGNLKFALQPKQRELK